MSRKQQNRLEVAKCLQFFGGVVFVASAFHLFTADGGILGWLFAMFGPLLVLLGLVFFLPGRLLAARVRREAERTRR